MTSVFVMLIIQGLVGAFDNLWHHEITEKLPSKPSALGELTLHTVREFLYGFVFLGLGWAAFHGGWAYVLMAILLIEVGVTLWDFIIEDKTRKLPKLERVLHTLLALNYGAVLAFLAPILIDWSIQPTALIAMDYGIFSWVMSLYAFGSFAWALRDFIAIANLSILQVPEWQRRPIRRGVTEHPQSILITGATGFIGKALTRRMIEWGNQVTVLTRDSAKARYLFGPHVTIVENLDDISVKANIDAIVNLAGESLAGGFWTQRRKRAFAVSRYRMGRDIHHLIKRLDSKPEVVITASAVGYYGNRRDDWRVAESTGPDDSYMARLCIGVERYARCLEVKGIRVCRLRIGLVLGHDDGILPHFALPIRLGLGVYFGDGRHWMPWIHIRDLVRLIHYGLTNKQVAGAVNAVAPNPVRHNDFVQAVAEHYRRPVFLRIPAFILQKGLGGMADLFLSGAKVVPMKPLAWNFHFAFSELKPALKDLLHVPYVKSTGICAYYNSECPVCDAEINHYRDRLDPDRANVRFSPISRDSRALTRYGLTETDAKKRLYVQDADGHLVGGGEAFALIWQQVPGYGWAAWAMRRRLIRWLYCALYDGVMVPLLARWNHKREIRKQEWPRRMPG